MDIFFNTQLNNRNRFIRSQLHRSLHLLLFLGLSIFYQSVMDYRNLLNISILSLYWGHFAFDLLLISLRSLYYEAIFQDSNRIIKWIYRNTQCSQNGLDAIITISIIVCRFIHFSIFLYTVVLYFFGNMFLENKYVQNIYIIYCIFCSIFYISYIVLSIIICFNICGLCRLATVSTILQQQRNIMIGYVDTMTIRIEPIRLKIIKMDTVMYDTLSQCYICCNGRGNIICNPCQHRDICLDCASRLDRCPQCRRTLEEFIIYELSNTQ